MKTIFILTIMGLVISSCLNNNSEKDSASSLHFLTMAGPQSCTIKSALKPQINICFRGSGVNQSIKTHTFNGVREYLNVLRPLNSEVTDNVVEDCSSPDLTVNVSNGNGVSTGGMRRINTYANKGYATILHELGHAFACLGDTYVGRQAGYCKKGQPESIMCWGAFGKKELYPDDIEGIRRQFKKIHPVNQSGAQASSNSQNQNQNQNQNQSQSQNSIQIQDHDQDGVADINDLCSKSPRGIKVWKSGSWIGCSEGQFRDKKSARAPVTFSINSGDSDSDGDGISNNIDLCSRTPQNARVWTKGSWVGCAEGQFRDR
jgi:hypothetical protein